MRIQHIVFFIFFLFEVPFLFAESKGGTRMMVLTPTGPIYPAPNGVVFPAFPMAAGINASALGAGTKKASAIQLNFLPALSTGGSNGLLGGIATRLKKVALGVGGDTNTGVTGTTTGIFAGAAYHFEKVGIGLGFRVPDFSMPNNFGIDLSGTVETNGKIYIAGVFHALNSTPQLDFGIGVKGKTYSLESSVLLPPLSAIGSNYIASVVGRITPGIVGVFFRVSYYTAYSYLNYAFGGSIWLGETANLLVQYINPQTLIFGLSLAF